MLDKLTITDENLNQEIKLKRRKPAKLSTFEKFYNNAKRQMSKIDSSSEVENQAQVSITPNENVSVFEKKVEISDSTEVKPDNQPTQSVTESIPNENIFASIEEYNKRLEKLGVICYKNTVSNAISNGSKARKLRVAEKVRLVLKHVLLHVAKVHENIDNEPLESKNETFDFGKPLDNMQAKTFEVTNQTAESLNQPNNVVKKSDYMQTKASEIANQSVESIKQPNNIVKLDEWLLNKDTNVAGQNISNTNLNDDNVKEIQTLVNQKASTEDSLATQKEILMNLREKIEKNKALCEAKRQELIEENMALTQELNDVLAEINQLSDIANQQDAFLSMSDSNNQEYRNITNQQEIFSNMSDSGEYKKAV